MFSFHRQIPTGQADGGVTVEFMDTADDYQRLSRRNLDTADDIQGLNQKNLDTADDIEGLSHRNMDTADDFESLSRRDLAQQKPADRKQSIDEVALGMLLLYSVIHSCYDS